LKAYPLNAYLIYRAFTLLVSALMGSRWLNISTKKSPSSLGRRWGANFYFMVVLRLQKMKVTDGSLHS
jgi:hypothetical protein